MIYFTAHTFKCVCHCRRAMFRVLGMYNFAPVVTCNASALILWATKKGFFFYVYCWKRNMIEEK